ncbi:MAG: DUF3365 domain-containing protein [Thermoanaerobaculales bacterium]|jgi:hypothetical protein|nr:DUF3365 domain-containing protein [Thermoanaerobaculales bacterium]
MRLPLVIATAVCLVVSGCGKPGEEPVVVEETHAAHWEKVLPGLMTETQKAQQELVLTATNALASELMGELTAALDQGGPAAGITVCREKAPQVAANVSETYGLRIGRTSHRLRNTANSGPAWSEAYVAGLEGEPTWVAGPNGELGALLPIRLRAECQMCHGPAEMIADEVMAAIRANYPEDQAVGFTEGELRGWFWVEVPPGEPGV